MAGNAVGSRVLQVAWPVIVVLLLWGGPSLANGDKPAIAFLQYRTSPAIGNTADAIWDMFEAYGLINAAEREALRDGEDLEGEHINVFWGSSSGDLATAELLVEDALDREADYILALSTPLALLATQAAQDMEDPPFVFFALVTSPFDAGIARSACLKPEFLAGTYARIPYEHVVPVVQLLVPEMETLGTFVNSDEPNSVHGANEIATVAESRRIAVEVAPIEDEADLVSATSSLLARDVDAILLAPGYVELYGAATIATVASGSGVPVIGPITNQAVMRSAAMGAGFSNYYREGLIVARMILAHINDAIDISRLAIHSNPSLGIAFNLDAAEAAGVEINPDLLKMAEIVIADGKILDTRPALVLPDMPLDQRMAEDAAFLAELECTEERIAEEEAQLEGKAR